MHLDTLVVVDESSLGEQILVEGVGKAVMARIVNHRRQKQRQNRKIIQPRSRTASSQQEVGALKHIGDVSRTAASILSSAALPTFHCRQTDLG